MPRRATAMMAVLAVIIHCVLGCCARCLSAHEHQDHADPCKTNCICCDHHHHHARPQLCLQPVSSSPLLEPTSEAAPEPDHDCLGCGVAKCVFIQNESACDGLTDALLLPVDLAWRDMASLAAEYDPQRHTPQQTEGESPHITPKVRLHLSLAVLTL